MPVAARLRRLIALLTAALNLVAAGSPASAKDVRWPQVHGPGSTRYSPLAQINGHSVSRLGLEWAFTFDDGAMSRVSPVIDDRRVFVSAGGTIYAIDATTGRAIWRYRSSTGASPNPQDIVSFAAIAGLPNNQGLGVGGGLVYAGLTDGRAIALDAKTGELVWSVSLTDIPAKKIQNVAAAPVYVNGVIYWSIATVDRYRGRALALDAKTGKELWRWYSIPGPGQPGHDTWPEDEDAWSWGGGNIWLPPAVDPALGLVFYGTGNAFPYQGGELRPGNNLYTNSVVALDIRNGALKWSRQLIHHDIWDADVPTPLILYDAKTSAGVRKAVAAMRSDGVLFTFDAASGAPLIEIAERSVPQDARNITSPTQPYPTGVESFLPACDSYRQFVPAGFALGCHWDPPAVGSNVLGLGNGVRVQPMSYSERTRYFYAQGSDALTWRRRLEDPYLMLFTARVPGADASRTNVLAAIDGRTGKVVWRKTTPVNAGGSLSTAGGLVFHRYGDGELQALDDRTGAVRWRFQTGHAGGASSPVTYSVGDTQYVALVEGSELLAFKLDGRLPARPAPPPPSRAATPELFSGPIEDTALITSTSLVSNDMYASGPRYGIDEHAVTPYRARVRAGSRVTFANNGHVGHGMAAIDGSWSTGRLAPGDTAELIFYTPGTFTYIDPFFPFTYGQLIVVAADAPAVGQPGARSGDGTSSGKLSYAQRCASCHGEDLAGRGESPALLGSTFLSRWQGRPGEELYALIKYSMPKGAPASLSDETYRAIAKYISAISGLSHR